MAVQRTINKVELTYESGVISYVRVFETLVLENPDLPLTYITQERLIRAALSQLLPGESNDLNDLIGNDIMPLANREDPST